jgi:hypothetical protein
LHRDPVSSQHREAVALASTAGISRSNATRETVDWTARNNLAIFTGQIDRRFSFQEKRSRQVGRKPAI